MPEVKFKHVVSCSSEDKQFPADNLLATESFKKWKCKAGEKQATVIIQLDHSSAIQSIDIGNEGSAFIEILVGRSADKEDNYDVLLSSQSFLSPAESRQETNFNRVRIFNKEQLEKNVTDQNWDRIKLVCSQPYNKNVPYGLSFVRVHAPSSTAAKGEKSSTTTSIGKFTLKSEDVEIPFVPGVLFKQKNKEPEPPTTEVNKMGGPSAIREAAKEYFEQPSTSTKSKTTDDERPARKKSPPKVEKPKKTSPPPDKNESKGRRKSPPAASTSKSSAAKPPRYVDFGKLFDKVVFVLSGFENPYRAQLRDKAVQMGAQYRADWGKGCTHLICAFSNTPKFNQVKRLGKIVKKEWILDSYKERKRLPSKKYAFEKFPVPDSDSDHEILAKSDDSEAADNKESKTPTTSSTKSPPPKKAKGNDDEKKNVDVYNADTDEVDTDDEIERVRTKNKAKEENPPEPKPTTTKNGGDAEDLPELPNFFNSMRFLLYGDFSAAERKQLNRYVVAFDGRVEQYMNENVTHVLTHNKWNDDFDEALKENPSIIFVKPDWVTECGRKNSFVDLSIIDMRDHPDGNFKYVMVAQDYRTNFVQLKPLQTKTPKEIADALLDVFCLFGPPLILQSCHGLTFAASVVKEVVELWPECSTAPCSQGRRAVKDLHYAIQNRIAGFTNENHTTQWSMGLRFIQFYMNQSFNPSINTAPFHAMFGRLPNDDMLMAGRSRSDPTNSNVASLEQTVTAAPNVPEVSAVVETTTSYVKNDEDYDFNDDDDDNDESEGDDDDANDDGNDEYEHTVTIYI